MGALNVGGLPPNYMDGSSFAVSKGCRDVHNAITVPAGSHAYRRPKLICIRAQMLPAMVRFTAEQRMGRSFAARLSTRTGDRPRHSTTTPVRSGSDVLRLRHRECQLLPCLKPQKCCNSRTMWLVQATGRTGRGCAKQDRPSLRSTFLAKTVSKVGIREVKPWLG